VALLSAFVLSVSATGFLYSRIRVNTNTPATQVVVAAATPLGAGSVPTASDLKLIAWPANVKLNGVFNKVEDVVGHPLMYPLETNELVRQRDLAAQGSGFGLTAKIPEGMRAVAVHTNEIVGVAGFIEPGSHVDVLVTYHPEGATGQVTRTVLQDVQVLSAGRRLDPDPQAKPENVNVVTLLVTPQDSERLVWATSQGSVQFVLRNGTDHDRAQAAEFAMEDPAPKKVEHKPVAKRVAALPSYEVETVAGEKRTVAKFSGEN
jgi:pilus assembly protein CpaB